MNVAMIINLQILANNEIFKLTIGGKSIGLFELNKNLNVARQIGFMFNQTNKLTIIFSSHLRYINIR